MRYSRESKEEGKSLADQEEVGRNFQSPQKKRVSEKVKTTKTTVLWITKIIFFSGDQHFNGKL